MRIYVPLTREEFDHLDRLATAQRRRPQDQAAVLLARALAEETSSPLSAGATDRPADQARELTEVR